MSAGEGFAQDVVLVEIDRDALQTLVEEEEVKVGHTDGHSILIRVHDRFVGCDKPDNRGVS
jgi:hypothetical protein